MLGLQKTTLTRLYPTEEICIGPERKIVQGRLFIKTFVTETSQVKELAKREIRFLEQLVDNPYVVKLIDADLLEIPRLILEHCEHGDLYTTIQEKAPMSKALTQSIAVQIASALDFLANQNIVHGDVKPEHIGITSDQQIKLLDFAYAQVLQDNEEVADHVSGTLPYASPEVLEFRRCGRASDWFALGIITFEMLFAALPFQGRGYSDVDIVRCICRERPRFPKKYQCSDDAIQLIKALLRKDPRRRLQTLSELQEAPWFHGASRDTKDKRLIQSADS